jgi:hemoglobin-like flavoprotein
MTERQIELVQGTWEHVTSNVVVTGELFYGRLFEINPQLRVIFSGDIKDQSRKLVSIISFAVRKLKNLHEITLDIQGLGERHHHYGVQTEHYAMVADSLLWTLEKVLGDRWNEEVKDAWIALYTTLADIMINSKKPALQHKRVVIL